jgi:glutamyl-Q tRNA(Asp) synthetase
MIYPGTCRALGLGAAADGAERLRVPEGIVEFIDRLMGRVAQDVEHEIGDFVLRRRDGFFAYQFAVVVDDADQGITDVVRGADLLLSTPRQIVLQRALGFREPRYLHVPVATTQAGEKLSKQTGATPVDARRAAALLGEALAFLGQPVPEPGAPATMLGAALAAWKPARIPCRPVDTVTFRDGPGDGRGV